MGEQVPGRGTLQFLPAMQGRDSFQGSIRFMVGRVSERELPIHGVQVVARGLTTHPLPDGRYYVYSWKQLDRSLENVFGLT